MKNIYHPTNCKKKVLLPPPLEGNHYKLSPLLKLSGGSAPAAGDNYLRDSTHRKWSCRQTLDMRVTVGRVTQSYANLCSRSSCMNAHVYITVYRFFLGSSSIRLKPLFFIAKRIICESVFNVQYSIGLTYRPSSVLFFAALARIFSKARGA